MLFELRRSFTVSIVICKYLNRVISQFADIDIVSSLDNTVNCNKETSLALVDKRGFFDGEPAGIRTPDTLLKRQVLCRLSYWLIER